MAKIGFIGLGAMGGRIAGKLLAAGHSLTVFNRSSARVGALEERGAKVASSPAEAVVSAEYIFTMLADDRSAREVFLEHMRPAVAGIRPGTIVIDCSTSSPAWARALAREVESRGAEFLECPVIGSRPQAEAGKLICLLGGKALVADRVVSLLAPFAESTFYVGDVGSASALKLLANGLFLSQIALLKEIFLVAEGFGLDRGRVSDVLQALPATSAALKGAILLANAGDTAPRFPLVLAEKDIRYLLEVCRSLNFDSEIFGSVHSYLKAGIQSGGGEKNVTAIV